MPIAATHNTARMGAISARATGFKEFQRDGGKDGRRSTWRAKRCLQCEH
jgi:hypothetical protein